MLIYVQQDELTTDDQRILDVNLACARDAKAHVEVLARRGPHRGHSEVLPPGKG